MILEIMRKNAANVIRIMLETIPKIRFTECTCKEFIKTAVIGG
jgi:hypothetical protein